jgi:hypothetical protein
MEAAMGEHDSTLARGDFNARMQSAAGAALDQFRRYRSIARVVGSIAAATVLTLAVVYGPHTRSERQLAATVEMERLAAKLERVQQVPPETALEVGRIVSQPEFDCAQVSCRPSIEQRNTAARAYLLSLLRAQTLTDVSSVGHRGGASQ